MQVDFAGLRFKSRLTGPVARRSHPETMIMPKLTVVAFDGTRFEIDAESGSTVMENAVKNGVPGIEAECGGACACATCHVYVDDAWTEKVGFPDVMEEDMLDFAFEPKPVSRLSCQIKMSDELDGVVVHVPEQQA